ncbi:hypothetical protein EOD41_05115 [Mucilaginibacter limnophilus]|uniref:Uncharacterized protein n=1 Tax=Mucilaginibacter limnophilus TaxID=1932778 RepID=A0A3S2UPQ2_9SPHI|nr:hypothetical protein [Mucilaginibacter limnophilus]RVU01346.1 hypothetical protein EOD41_05115 [Mucilaginibacter limnophilus]
MEVIPFLILLLVFLSALIYLFFVFFRWLYWKGYQKVAIVIPSIIIAYITYSIYTAFYPDDDFFFQDFKTVTLKDVPKSAKIIAKDASYPDHHGKYISVSLMKLSKHDYKKLLDQLTNDKNFSRGKMQFHSEEFVNVMGEDFDLKEIKFQFNKNNSRSGESYIAFLNDEQSVICFFYNG